MVREKIYHGTEHFWVWKCVYCGDYIDRVILENRQIQKSNREKSMKDHRERPFKLSSEAPSV